MRLPFWRRHAARRRPFSPVSLLLTITSLVTSPASAISFTPAPAANLDLSQLGRVGVAGDFTGISLFQFEEQNERPFNSNGSEALLARLPNGVFAPIVDTDATIQTMCTFIMSDGTNAGVVIGGNFTSLGDLQSTAIALFNPNTSTVTPLPGLSGQVNAVLCDQDTNSVYVGGSFGGANSTNAVAWVGTQGWTNLPFAGFNGPVTSITKASNGHIIFGGSFTGLGNASLPSTPDSQVINLSSASISSGSSTTTQGFSDPKNIVCKTSGADGAGNTWLLQDDSPGFWQATFNYGFRPSKLRLYNTHQDGRGTKTWRFTALPINGIMNFTYIDPATGNNASCTSECPLSNDANVTFQDFHFVNIIGMNEFRIDISAFYGSGGGLDGIELFQNDIFAYAINDFNEPSCAGLQFGSQATPTGPWVVTPSHSSTSEYLTAQLSSPITNSSASIVFTPDIRQSGNYSVSVYTPGCLPDGTCSSRGQFVITGQMTAVPTNKTFAHKTLYQTNDYDKYDIIYSGMIDASSSSFRPQLTMTPLAGQSVPNMTFVAQRVGFILMDSTGGLNGLFEYDPSSSSVNISDFTNSAFDQLGASFNAGSAVNVLATSGDVTFIGGNFTSKTARNIVAMNGKDATTQSLDGGLNGEVDSMFLTGTSLFVGGSFNGTLDNSVQGLDSVAVYDTAKNTWNPLGAGVNGRVLKVVGMTMNVTGSTPEVVVSVNGDFNQLQAFGNNSAVSVSGFGVWVPSQGNWLQNLQLPVESVNGILSTSMLDITGNNSLYAGSLSSATLGATGAATVSNTLGRFPVKIQAPTAASSGGLSKRDTVTSDSSTLAGVVTGVFDTNNGRNMTILGGHFAATATDGSTINNLLILDGSNNDNVFGVGPQIQANSTFVAMAVQGDVLFAGGNVSGTVDGNNVNALITYNLASKSFNTQPPALNGGNGTVTSIAIQTTTGNVYVGGSFARAGGLGCPGVCFFSTASQQWNQPGNNIDGTVSSLMWASDTILLAGGTLKVNSTATTFLAKYDASKQVWDSYPGSDQLPGPVDVITAGTSDGSQIWVSGTASNGSVYLMKYDGSTWQSAGDTLRAGTQIRGLQIFSLTSSHDSTPLVNSNEIVMLTGSIVLPTFGSASAVLFNGTTFTPYALTTNSGNTAGSIAHIFTEKNDFFNTGSSQLPLVFVVLIGLAISLALMFLIVLAGLFLDRLRKRREGYVPAPTSMYDRGSGIQRIPPHELLEGLGKGRAGAPHV
ncbi:cortical protein marker for cell polarity-domain-containing protein [Diplogelasinospora grovesii]|uniref:Cortical protein marker for cell polarity-domain-containing protein n=1 Tax=Diplogelasinospora grovesii TaxID=303347 RepID=A0AAN6N5X5_9PEZI|nr:cortical protein marker for cell polarity-domain-containing protein [Diplogelasinospora grovesii]